MAKQHDKETARKPDPVPEQPLASDAGYGDAALLLATARTPEEVAAVIAKYPMFTTAFFLVVQTNFGNAFAAEVAGLVHQAEGRGVIDHVEDVAHKDTLAGVFADPDAITGGSGDVHAAVPGDRLPFDAKTGWNAIAINSRLGQYDRIAGTDSDANRCVQAASLAIHVFRGPAGTVEYLRTYVADNKRKSKQAATRVAAAAAVIERVCAAIEDRSATYGDLSWAQEALHDMFQFDEQGSPDSAFALGPTDDYVAINVVCRSAAEIMTYAGTLKDGEQLMCQSETVAWNLPFHDAEDAGEKPGNTMTVGKDTLHREREPARGAPDPRDFDERRDDIATQHQIMIAREAGVLYVYDPEVQAGGVHLHEAALDEYLGKGGMANEYRYVFVAGVVSPARR